MSGTAAGTATTYTGTFHGRAGEVARVRREIAGYLGDCPASDDLVLIADELAANCVLHTRSRGEFFHVRCELSDGSARIEVEDMGGPWRARKPDDRPHGLDIVQALTGDGGWGTTVTPGQTRVVWPGSNGDDSRDGRPSQAGLPACAVRRDRCYRPRYLNIQRLNYLWTIRQSSASEDHGQPDHIA